MERVRLSVIVILAAAAGTARQAHAESDRLGRLDWGGLTPAALARAAQEKKGAAGKATARVIEVAQQTLEQSLPAASSIHMQGLVFTDPDFKRSQAATKDLPYLYNWAMCARVAHEPLASRCLAKASETALAWVAAYVPTGDPIDESRLVPVLLAIDLLAPVLSAGRRERLLAWTENLAQAGDELYSSWKPTDGRRSNNWAAWRLLLRGMSATITGYEGRERETRELLKEFVAVNILADGGTKDFHDRDALHYHVYDLEALVQLALYCPRIVGPAEDTAIEKAVRFIEPYFAGRSRHVEFVRTGVKFDVVRREAGDPSFQNAPWDPAGARQLLRLARAKYPAVASWTAGVVDERYSPMVKQLAALR